MTDVENFISTYGSSSESRISFAWNGKRGDDFHDDNYALRKQVLDAVIPTLDSVDLLLVRDLFRAETIWSKEAWCIDLRVQKLAAALIKRGRAQYLEDYFVGRWQSMDSACACSITDVDVTLATELVRAADDHLASEQDGEKRKFWERNKEILLSWEHPERLVTV